MSLLLRNLRRVSSYQRCGLACGIKRRYSDQIPLGSDSGAGGQNYEGPGKTTVNILNEETGLLMVDSFSVHGFRLNNATMVFGPMAIFPTCVLAWKGVLRPQDITAESLAVFALLHPRPEVVLVGAGDRGGLDALLGGEQKDLRQRREVVRRLKSTGLNVEVMATEHAVSTYNYLCQEGRAVGAALLPPDKVRMIRDEDIYAAKTRNKEGRDVFEDKNPWSSSDLMRVDTKRKK